MDELFDVKLTYDELLRFDNSGNESIQKIIDNAKELKNFGFEFSFMNKALLFAVNHGKLEWRQKSISNCSFCDKKRDYYVYSQTSKNHQKGDKNYNEPKYYSGIAFNEGFITLQGHGDVCGDCAEKHQVLKRLVDYVLDNDLKIELPKYAYRPSKYKKDEIRICFECNEEIFESEMGKLPAMFGGEYPGECPKCKAKSLPFGHSHKTTNKFRLIQQIGE